MKYFIRTFGCQMNMHDSENIAGLLEADGMIAASGVEDADVVLLNTCCIRENADNKFYGNLGQLKEHKDNKPELLIAVAGCLAQKDRDQIRQRANYVDVVFGTHNLQRAAELIRHAQEHGPIVEILEEAVQQDWESFPSFLNSDSLNSDSLTSNSLISNSVPSLPSKRMSPHKAMVTIQIGCDNSCAFCIVPSVRGPEISRPTSDIISEVENLAHSGVKEIMLLGQNVNSYGRDLALRERKAGDKDVRLRPRFAELLKEVSRVEGICRVRYISPHPKDLLPETILAMAETPEVCEHLHLPLQSGSNKILRAMKRGYTSEKYLKRLKDAESSILDLAISTDLIVGFPGETEADFEETLEVAAEAEFDAAYSYIFSPRPNTEAAKLTDAFIDPKIIGNRFDRLKIVLEHSALQKHRARIGRIEEVLVEGVSPKTPQNSMGRTRQNKIVHWETGDEELTSGSLVLVEVQKAAPYFLNGELKEVISVHDISMHDTVAGDFATPVKINLVASR